jgi:hypothetical protein
MIVQVGLRTAPNSIKIVADQGIYERLGHNALVVADASWVIPCAALRWPLVGGIKPGLVFDAKQVRVEQLGRAE